MKVMEELLAEGLIGWLFILIIVVSSVLGVHYYLSTRRYYQLARKIPAPPGLPIIGHALDFLKGTEEVFHNVWDTIIDGDVCKLWLGSRLLVFIRNPADVELVLSSRTHLCRPSENNYFEPWQGDGINTVSGCKWKAYRQLIAPIFQLPEIFEPILRYNSRTFENKLFKSIGKDVDCYNYMSESVMEVLLVSILGDNNNTDESKNYSQAIQKLSKIIRCKQNKLWFYPVLIFNLTKLAKLQKNLLVIISRFTRQAVKKRKEVLIKHRQPKDGYIFENQNSDTENNNNNTDCMKEAKRSLSLLDLLMEISNNGITLMDCEVQNQVDALMLEGHNTTALSGSYFLKIMADRPDVQEKCVAELNEIFGDSDRPVTLEDTLEMKYLERCLMETLRIYPPVSFIARELQEDLRLASTNLTIPAETTVMIDVKKVHMNKDLYSSPDAFDPDNFLLENCVSRHYYSFIPFSAGPKSCIGRKYSIFILKVLISSVLRKYRILPASHKESMKPKVLKWTDELLIRLELRKEKKF
ncbi:cytochrome P450 4g15 [Halyomorpha halys]|uniref:cytochrome P450 4g15 n=1 Tax=Halyomorpha halys TaxID=286706 RepID=UPI0006D50B49|nr:cytochrome P450 4g15 [Halyomorpha halys]